MFYTRVRLLQLELTEQAGLNPLRDRYLVGYLAAVKDLVNVEAEEVELPEEREHFND